MMSGNKHKPWTPEEDARLRSLLEGGTSSALVGAKLKRTTKAVMVRASILKLAMRQSGLKVESN
jgi:hypothetical protein